MKAQGHLAEEVAELSTLTALNMQSNQLNGTLPAAYSAAGVLPRLLNLVLSSNQLSGASVHMMPGGGWHSGLAGAGWCARNVHAAFGHSMRASGTRIQGPLAALAVCRHAPAGVGGSGGAACPLPAGARLQ